MSSRDRSDRSREPGRASDNTNANRPASGSDWDFDPAEIDRYLSGRSSSRGQQQPARSSTAESLERLRRARDEQQQARQAAGRQSPRVGQSTGSLDSVPPTAPRANAQPSQRPTPQPQSTWDGATTPDWDENPFPDDDVEDTAQTTGTAGLAPRLRPQRPSITLRRPAGVAKPAMPAFIRGADLANDATALALIGISLLSLAIMAILVANRIDGVLSPFATHVNASGGLEDYEKNTAIWRLPLLAAMFLLMNLVAAWFISPTDRFLSRFLLGVSNVVQLVVWIALIRFLW